MFETNVMQPGYQFNGVNPQAQPKVMNYLTADEIKELQSQRNDFSLALTPKEMLQSKCNHRLPDGSGDSLKYDPETGKAYCTICGYEFRPIEADTSIESIKDASDRIVDILQTIKILYTDMPADAATNYFQIIPLIAKIPQLFEFAAKNFNKHEFNAWQYNQYNMGGMAMLNGLQSMFGGMGMGQPAYNPYAAAPQQPVGYPAAPAPMMGQNPFGYPGASQPMMGGYQPQTQGFAYNPAPAPQAAPAPVAPAADPAATTTVTNTVTV